MSTEVNETKVSPELSAANESAEKVIADAIASTETVPAKVTKVTVSARRDLAIAGFAGTDSVEMVAALFADVPNGREFLDETYNAAAALVIGNPLEMTAEKAATLPALLSPIAERRDAIGTAMTTLVPTKTARAADPIAERAAMVEKLGRLSATWSHVAASLTWIEHMFDESDPGDLSDAERLTFAAMDVPAKVSAATEKIASALTAKVAGGTATGDRKERTESDRVAPAIGTVFTDAKGRFVTLTGETNARSIGPDAWTLDTGETFDSISAAAKHVAGGTETNGWLHFSK